MGVLALPPPALLRMFSPVFGVVVRTARLVVSAVVLSISEVSVLGAHDRYRLSPHEGVLLCPDCLWSWQSMLVSCPARPCCVRPPGELARHLESVTSQTQPGAGTRVARPKGPVSWSRLRRRKWLLRFLDHHASYPQADVFVQCQSSFPSAPPPLLQHAFSQVIRILCREGHLLVTRRGGVLVLSRPP